MNFSIRDFEDADAEAVNALALAAYAECRDAYDDWPLLAQALRTMAEMRDRCELIVAINPIGDVIGVVAYVGPGRPKGAFFDPDWPIVRLLAVAPAARRQGVGRALVRECVARALRDRAPLIALNTADIMQSALRMYLRMGFIFHSPAPRLFGVLHAVYVKPLTAYDAVVQDSSQPFSETFPVTRKLISSGSSFEQEYGYSRAVVDGDWVFVSGTTGFNYETMTISDDIAEQTDQCLRNIEAALKQGGASLRDVVRVVYLLPVAGDFPLCRPTLRKYFGEIRPAATMISAGLADPRMKIEIEVTARIQ